MCLLSKSTHPGSPLQTPSGRSGFTLVELLVVITIIVALMALVRPALDPVLRGSQITQAGQAINDQLSLARQTALSKNHAVEVRFYQYVDPEIPGDRVVNSGSGCYHAFQSFEMLDSGSAVAISKLQRLPTTVLIDSGATLSSLFDHSLVPSQQKAWTSSDPQVNLARIGNLYNCDAFRFLADGSTNLSPTVQWFLTLHRITEGDALKSPPKNFLTLQIDANNGHIKTYRP